MISRIETVFGPKEIEMIRHPGNEEIEIPKTVYKYRDWSNQFHKRILNSNEVYFTSSTNFNDPFDCGIDTAFHLLKEDENLRLAYFTRVVERVFPQLSVDDKKRRIKESIDERLYEDDEYMERMRLKWKAEFNRQYGFFCVTPVRDNILMWSHYANSHKGFCVGFDSSKLFLINRGGGGDVMYVDEYPIISPLEDSMEQMVKMTNTKAKFWDYEIEYRLRRLVEGERDRTVRLENDIITQVIFGCAMEERHKEKIRILLKKNNPSAKLFQAVPQKRAFEMEIIEIM